MAIELKLVNKTGQTLEETDDGKFTELFTDALKIGQEGSMFSEISAETDTTGTCLALKYGDDLYYRHYYKNTSNQSKMGNKLPNRYGDVRGITTTGTSLQTYSTILYTVTCATALVMCFSSSTGSGPSVMIAITGDNDGKPVVIYGGIGTNGDHTPMLNTGSRVAFARDANFVDGCSNSFDGQYVSMAGSVQHVQFGWNQVVAMPFVGYSAFDDAVYTPDAAWVSKGPVPVSYDSTAKGSNMWQRLEFNGYIWLTNGYWMFRDEEVES